MKMKSQSHRYKRKSEPCINLICKEIWLEFGNQHLKRRELFQITVVPAQQYTNVVGGSENKDLGIIDLLKTNLNIDLKLNRYLLQDTMMMVFFKIHIHRYLKLQQHFQLIIALYTWLFLEKTNIVKVGDGDTFMETHKI